MAGLDAIPAVDATATIGGSVGRSVLGGVGGTTPILAHGDEIHANLYGLHQEEILRPQVPILGAGLIPRADYGVRTPEDLAGLRADLIKRLGAKLPRSGDLTISQLTTVLMAIASDGRSQRRLFRLFPCRLTKDNSASKLGVRHVLGFDGRTRLAADIDARQAWVHVGSCVVFVAASNLEEVDPLQTVAGIASRKIDEAIALLDEYRNADGPAVAEPSAKSASRAARAIAAGVQILSNSARTYPTPLELPFA